MPLLCGCFSLNGWTERRGTCAHGTSDPVCICVCVPYCHRMLLIQQLWICCIYAVCLYWCWFFWLCSSAVQRCCGLCKWMGQVVRTFDQNEKGRGVRMTGIRCLRGQAAVISWDMPLEMELFPSYCFNGLKQARMRERQTVMAALRSGTRRIGSKRGERKSTVRERRR